MPTYTEAIGLLTAPHGPFALATIATSYGTCRAFVDRPASIQSAIARSVELYGDRTFLVQGNTRVTFQQHAETSFGAAHALLSRYGMNQGDRLGILGFNSPAWIASLFGTAAAGGIVVPLKPQWRAPEVKFALQHSDCRFLVVDQALWGRVSPIMPDLAGLTVFFIGDSAPAGTVSFGELISSPVGIPPQITVNEEDPFTMIYTSGTTGIPKAAIATHLGSITQAQSGMLSRRAQALTSQDSVESDRSWILVHPIANVNLHVVVVHSLLAGSKVVFTTEKHFNPLEILSLMATEKITDWLVVPGRAHQVAEAIDPTLRDGLASLQALTLSGYVAFPSVAKTIRERFPPTVQLDIGYGLTEATGTVAIAPGEYYTDRIGRGCVGLPLPCLEVQIVDEGGLPLPHGQTGEIYIRGAAIATGYWKDPERTASAFVDGWFRTADIGRMDPDGALYIVGRKGDRINRAGAKIDPMEIESSLMNHPSIAEVAVVGEIDELWGQKIIAFVVLKPSAQATETELINLMTAHLARYKVPERVVFRTDPLPRNAAGKVLKEALLQGLHT